jgi:hypothetical protein
MRRLAIRTVAAAAILALAAPGAADARAHHARHHRRGKHAAVRFERLGPVGPAASSPPAGSWESGGGSSTGAPSQGTSETAGTVASFESGVLTITLNDKSSVSGKVTEQTEITCEAVEPTAHAADHGGGDEGEPTDDRSSDEQASENNDQAEQQDMGEASCGLSSLKAGAVVREAELRISSTGAVFTDIELLS